LEKFLDSCSDFSAKPKNERVYTKISRLERNSCRLDTKISRFHEKFRDSTADGRRPRQEVSMQPRIAVISGVRLAGAFPLSSGEFIIGRDAASDLPIPDETVAVRHCVVKVSADRCTIQDCGSLNGTTVNGARVTGQPTLRHGDRIGVGNAELVFLLEADVIGSGSPVLDDAAPIDPQAIAVSIESNAMHQTMFEFGSELRFYRRDIPAMREKMLTFIFTRIPAEHAAIVLVQNGGSQIEALAHDRNNPARPVRVNRAMAERVYRSGKAMMSPSSLCVPMQGFEGRLGLIYAATSGREVSFDTVHFQLLSVIATVGSFALEHAAYYQRLEDENSRLKRDLEIRHELVGDSDAMRELGHQISLAAPTESTVLIQGESGTGKELVARAVHRNSKRSNGPFVAINCGAITESLLESELFGHEKGAFTGAIAQKKGKFEMASGGTLFLDEVGELPASLQVKLLRVLQEREIERLGGTKPIKVDIRLIAATNRDLDAAVVKKEFRNDLYFRLKVVTIDTPALRERGGDILRLARHFVSRFSREQARTVNGISPEAEAILLSYEWPGNVRELQNIMERAIVVGGTDTVLAKDLPKEILKAADGGHETESLNLKEVGIAAQRRAVEKAISRADGNWREAAILLGCNRTEVYKIVKKLGMDHLL
jgi:Nif-specific regulatory protein